MGTALCKLLHGAALVSPKTHTSPFHAQPSPLIQVRKGNKAQASLQRSLFNLFTSQSHCIFLSLPTPPLFLCTFSLFYAVSPVPASPALDTSSHHDNLFRGDANTGSEISLPLEALVLLWHKFPCSHTRCEFWGCPMRGQELYLMIFVGPNSGHSKILFKYIFPSQHPPFPLTPSPQLWDIS